jgi:hypothetical protein
MARSPAGDDGFPIERARRNVRALDAIASAATIPAILWFRKRSSEDDG